MEVAKRMYVYQCKDCKNIVATSEDIDVHKKTCKFCNKNKPNMEFKFSIQNF